MNKEDRIHHQAVGAYGEKAVEAELLRWGWIPANVNASVKNAANYDIVAQKKGEVALIRVKTCGPGQRAFQWSIAKGKRFSAMGVPENDFTVLVSMGEARDDDEFWIVPTPVVRRRLKEAQDEYYGQLKRDGQPRVDNGQCTLWLDQLKRETQQTRQAYGIADAWKSYRNSWALLGPT